MPMEHARTLKVLGLTVALLLAGLTIAKRSDPAEAHFVLLPDAIPAVDDPRFQDTGRSSDRVLGVAAGGQAKAYPIPILNYHEVVNDEFGDRSVAVTYCPLCGTGIAYDREVDGETLTFSVSGRLYRNNLVMVDDRTGSLWSQIEGRAISGALEGTELTVVSSTMTTLSDWRDRHPDTEVMSPPGGRNYDQDPYAGYDRSDDVLYPSDGTPGPLAPKDRVYGVEIAGDALAFPQALLVRQRVVEATIGDVDVVATYHRGAIQAFRADGRNFTHAGGTEMVDEQGQSWNLVTGEGPNATLATVDGLPAFWFAWADFHPDTRLHGAEVQAAESPGFQFNWFHPVSIVAVGALVYAMFHLGLWCWQRWRHREGYAAPAWFEPEHGWVHGVLVGIVAGAVLFDATQTIHAIYRIPQLILGGALLAYGVALGAEWYVFDGRKIKPTILDPEGLYWDLEGALDAELPPVKTRDGSWPWTDAVLAPADHGEVWITPTGDVAIPADDETLTGIVEATLADWTDGDKREAVK